MKNTARAGVAKCPLKVLPLPQVFGLFQFHALIDSCGCMCLTIPIGTLRVARTCFPALRHLNKGAMQLISHPWRCEERRDCPPLEVCRWLWAVYAHKEASIKAVRPLNIMKSEAICVACYGRVVTGTPELNLKFQSNKRVCAIETNGSSLAQWLLFKGLFASCIPHGDFLI